MNENPLPTPTNTPEPSKFDNNKSVLLILLLITLGIGLIATAVWGASQAKSANQAKSEISSLEEESSKLKKKVVEIETELTERKKTSGESSINKDSFQAVFLKNDQVYYGKITAISENQLTLENIYYTRDNGGGDISLVKLGNELHGPEDKMFIERKELTFWENLKEDSQVVNAIREYEKQNP